MPLPPAHFLVGAAAGELARPSRLPRLRVWLVAGALGVLPDMDTGIGILLGRGNEFHGIFTHTTVAVLAVAALAWLLGGGRWAAIATAAYASHLVLDLLEARRMTSVQPLWPLSDERLPSLARIFPGVPWRRGGGPEGAALSLAEEPVLKWLLVQTLLALGVFIAVVALSAMVRGLAALASRRSGAR